MKYRTRVKKAIKKPTLKAEMLVGEQMNIKGDFVKIDEMNEIAKEKGIGAGDIPDEFTATVMKTVTDTDEYNRKCLKAELDIDGVGLATVKYTPLHVEELVKALQKLNVDNFDGRFKFKKVMIGTMGFSRPYPIEKV